MTTEIGSRSPFAAGAACLWPLASGYVTHDSIEDLLPWIEGLLFRDGDPRHPRSYRLIRLVEDAGWEPQVKSSQEAHRVELLQDDRGCAIQVHDTDGSWSLSGHLATQPSGEDGDVLRKSMHVVVTDRHLEVRSRTPEGLLAWWCLWVEEEAPRA